MCTTWDTLCFQNIACFGRTPVLHRKYNSQKIKHNANFDRVLASLNMLPWRLTALYLDDPQTVNFAIYLQQVFRCCTALHCLPFRVHEETTTVMDVKQKTAPQETSVETCAVYEKQR